MAVAAAVDHTLVWSPSVSCQHFFYPLTSLIWCKPQTGMSKSNAYEDVQIGGTLKEARIAQDFKKRAMLAKTSFIR